MAGSDWHLLHGPYELRDELCHAANDLGANVTFTGTMNRKQLTAMGSAFRSVFAVNVSRAWSMGRLAAVARMVNTDATVACAFTPPSSLSQLTREDFHRWFARTPGGLVSAATDPWRWSAAHRSTLLAPSSLSPSIARSFVGAALADWHAAIDESDVELVASELVTNAVEHSSSSTIDLDIACSDNHVYVAVRDTANLHFPIFRRPANGTHAGRGLRIIASYAMWWGVTVRPDHKTVWAEFATPARG